jgi:3-oxoacyl-[acyl-carrier-protein] synthase II
VPRIRDLGPPSRRVVITGVGAVTAFGWGTESLRHGLLSGSTAITTPRFFDTSGQRTHVAGEVPPPPAQIAAEHPRWRHLTHADAFAVAAAAEASRHARLDPSAHTVGLFFGGSTGGMLECEEYVARLLGCADGHPRLALVAAQQINAPADTVARHLGLTGPVETVSSACASGGLAIGAALEAVRQGTVDIALAGGADALCRLTYAGFNSLRSVDERPCRPFRADRQGLSIGEGAGVLVLETLELARSRGADPIAELLGAGGSCDAHHMTAPHPQGRGAAEAIQRALDDAGLAPDDVDCINAHGTGTPHNDVSEARALEQVFGPRWRSLPVTATKASLGHQLGCSGAIEAVAAVLGLADGVVQPTAGDGEIDPEAAVDLVTGSPRPLPEHAVAVSTSFAFGGANAAVVVGQWPGTAGS